MQTRIKEIRQSKGMTLRMLADLSGISKATICNIEANRVSPITSTLEALSDALSVSIVELFEESKAQTEPKKYKDTLSWAYTNIKKECTA